MSKENSSTMFKKGEDHFLPAFRGNMVEQEMDFSDLIGEEIRNSFHMILGTVVDVETEINNYGRVIPFLVLDTGERIDMSWKVVVDK